MKHFGVRRVANSKASRSGPTFEVNQQKIELRDEQISRTHLYGLSSAVGNFLTEEQGGTSIVYSLTLEKGSLIMEQEKDCRTSELTLNLCLRIMNW